MEKHCLVVVYINGLFLFSNCLTDVAFFAFVNRKMTKASRCLMDLICKPHHHWTRHNVAALMFIWLDLCISHSVSLCCCVPSSPLSFLSGRPLKV